MVSKSMTKGSAHHQEPLAIVGIGLRLPMDSNNPQEFWSHLIDGKNGITKVPADRWNADYFHDSDFRKDGKITNDKGGFIKNIKAFDNEFFHMSAYQCAETDPQVRILLEVTFEALEDAGLRLEDVSNSRTSVFTSSFQIDYQTICCQSSARDRIGSSVATGVGSFSLSNRISYQFNLKGPSVTVDTACSGSMVALHHACQSIWNGEADMAITGGANALLRPESSMMLARGGFLSPTGFCKTFDASADGYVRSEGVVLIIIKPLRAALENEDRIYALINGTAINHDGYKAQSYSVPSTEAQVSLMTSLYHKAGITPSDIDYVECHGTGTKVGDPLEIEALRQVIGQNRHRQCYVGSVKTNIGHLEGTAGIVGLVKAALILNHRKIPPNLHYHQPRAELRLAESKFVVPTQVIQCTKVNNKPLLAGVNSFGAGGANGHAILSEFIPQTNERTNVIGENNQPNTICLLFLISDISETRLLSTAKKYVQYLNETSHDITDICYTLLQRRSIFPKQLLITGYSKEEIIDLLQQYIDGKQHPQILKKQSSSDQDNHRDQSKGKLAFAYSGQGGQWVGMGRQLIAEMPLFKSKMMEIDKKFQAIAGWSLIAELDCVDASISKINDTKVVQPLIMAVQIALTHVWTDYFGVKPDGFVGHSVGEIAAAHCSSVIDLDTAVYIIYHRSAIQNRLTNKGKMLALGMSERETNELLRKYPGEVSIAAMNGPKMTVIAGDSEILLSIAVECESKQIFQAFVKTQIPYHTSIMEEIKDELLTTFRNVRSKTSKDNLYSTVSARKVANIDGSYWYENVRKPVLFIQTVEKMMNDGYKQFIEIGPHPVLIFGIKQLLDQKNIHDGLVINSIKRQNETTQLFQNVGLYWIHNNSHRNVAFKKMFPHAQFIFDLPRYTWQHKDFWLETYEDQEERLAFKYNGGHPFLRHDSRFLALTSHQIWRANINPTNAPYLADHVVNNAIVFPAVGYIELALAVGNLYEQKKSTKFSLPVKCFLEDLMFETAIILSEDKAQAIDTQVELTSPEGHFIVFTKPQQSDDSDWKRHASGKMNVLDEFPSKRQPKLNEIVKDFHDYHLLDPKEVYLFTDQLGFTLGEHFQCARNMWYKNSTILSKSSLPQHVKPEARKYHLHPALFDSVLHGFFAELMKSGGNSLYLPHSIDRLTIYTSGADTVYSYMEFLHHDDEIIQADLWIYNEDGDLIAEIYGFTVKNLSPVGLLGNHDITYEHQWMQKPLSVTLATHGSQTSTCRLILIVDDLNNVIATEISTKLSSSDSKYVFEQIDVIDDEHRLKEKIQETESTIFVVYIPSVCQQNQQILVMEQMSLKYLAIIQILKKLSETRQIYLRLITKQCNNTLDHMDATKARSNTDEIQMDHALLYGMSRVVQNECAHLHMRSIDVDESGVDDLDGIYDDLFDLNSDLNEREIMYRHNMRHVRRLMRCDHEKLKQSFTKQMNATGDYYQLEMEEKGVFDSIIFRQQLPKTLKAHEVEIEVHAAGINFKDVMNALGQLSKRAVAGSNGGNILGLEMTGIIVKKGLGVEHFNIGDEVLSQSANSFSGRATASYMTCMKKPKHLTHAESATVPVVYVTAYYSLINLAKMTRDDTVLIHSAAGGVGIACINVAKYIGAKIIATVSSQAKREFLEKEYGISPEFIFDSRSPKFYRDIMNVTNKQGVDIVMNSLSGTLLTQSIKCLKPFGRFIEIGKADIYQNKPLCLERLGANISYFVVDIDQLNFQKPHTYFQVLNELEILFDQKHLKPLPATVFSVNDIADAFRSLMTGQTIGKLVVNMEDQVVTALPPKHLNFMDDGAFIITGGTRGLGLLMAEWIVQRGITKVVLVSRKGIQSSADQAFVDKLASTGIEIHVRPVDIRSMDEVEQLFAEVVERFGSIQGIIHSAAILRDASIEKIDRDSFLDVIQTKAIGAWNLHTVSLKYTESIRYFILFSSISSTIGNFGQINYAAANYFLDTLAEYRHQRRLPCTSVNLGLLGEYAGMSSTRDGKKSVAEVLKNYGILTMPLQKVQKQLEMAILEKSTSRVTAVIDWMTLKESLPIIGQDARFTDILRKKNIVGESKSHQSLKDKILSFDNINDAVEVLEKDVSAVIRKTLGLGNQPLELDQSLGKIGFDSLSFTQLRNWLLKTLDINYPIIQLIKAPSIQFLVNEIIKNIVSSHTDITKASPSLSNAKSDTVVSVQQTISPPTQNGMKEPNLSVSNQQKEDQEHENENENATNNVGTETTMQEDDETSSTADEIPKFSTSPRFAYILGIGTANPPICNKTDEVWQRLKLEYQSMGMSETDLEQVRDMYDNSGIEAKYCHADFTEKTFTENSQEYFNDKYRLIAPNLAAAAAKKAIEDWGGSVEDITHIITCTSTGILLPDLHCLLVKKLKLKATVEHASVNMMGCTGGLASMRTAKAFALQNPQNRVLMVCIELFSLHYKPILDMDVVSFCLRFGDGSGAMIVGCAPKKHERCIYEIIHTGSQLLPDTEDFIEWSMSPIDEKFKSDPSIPTIVAQNISSILTNFMRSCPLPIRLEDCDWPIHPQGVTTLLKLQSALKISLDRMQSSWNILQKYGNMSSVASIFIMDDVRTRTATADSNITLSIGPGVTIEIALLKKLQQQTGSVQNS